MSAGFVFHSKQTLLYEEDKARWLMSTRFDNHEEGVPLSVAGQRKVVLPELLSQIYGADHGFDRGHRTTCDEALMKLSGWNLGHSDG